ncbi:hypothetical protein [Paraburkholderia sacchari]|uniref:hypothetical protein n=1 Tax=Paraburkholderia sacchari TaxID=159450 RepID=UPI001BCE96C3|nr:hypothetical protein [Paraburkholderia sacchari]
MNEKPSITWEVWPITNSGRCCGPSVWVKARDRHGAEAVGKRWMRTLGRCARQVHAEVYRPELDLEIRGYVRRVIPAA